MKFTIDTIPCVREDNGKGLFLTRMSSNHETGISEKIGSYGTMYWWSYASDSCRC